MIHSWALLTVGQGKGVGIKYSNTNDALVLNDIIVILA